MYNILFVWADYLICFKKLTFLSCINYRVLNELSLPLVTAFYTGEKAEIWFIMRMHMQLTRMSLSVSKLQIPNTKVLRSNQHLLVMSSLEAAKKRKLNLDCGSQKCSNGNW